MPLYIIVLFRMFDQFINSSEIAVSIALTIELPEKFTHFIDSIPVT